MSSIDFSNILSRVDSILEEESSIDEKLQSLCELLDQEIDIFNWTGFYLVNPEKEEELVLGPYVGEPTDHTHIAFGTGICGQAADTLETFVVQDVSQETNYLACSVEVEAEIVVPIIHEGIFLGEIDIDSHTRNSITDEHRKLLEEIAGKLAPYLA